MFNSINSHTVESRIGTRVISRGGKWDFFCLAFSPVSLWTYGFKNIFSSSLHRKDLELKSLNSKKHLDPSF